MGALSLLATAKDFKKNMALVYGALGAALVLLVAWRADQAPVPGQAPLEQAAPADLPELERAA